MKYVFGPVNSRRLGRSLGIDLIPYKVCSFNCVYCECGGTTILTDEVREYVPVHEVIREIDEVLSKSPELDVVTFSGSGEPTLNSGIGKIIGHIREKYPQYKIAVLTNSTLLHREEVRRRLLGADMIFPSLDAAGDEAFEKIMRPAKSVNVADIIDGLVSLRHEFKGRIYLEIFMIEGINDTPDELAKLKSACEKIEPDEVHLNSLDRPGAEKWVRPVSPGRMDEIKKFFEPLPVRIISRAAGSKDKPYYPSDLEKRILEKISIKPISADELAVLLDARIFDVIKAADKLVERGDAEIISDNNSGIYRSTKVSAP